MYVAEIAPSGYLRALTENDASLSTIANTTSAVMSRFAKTNAIPVSDSSHRKKHSANTSADPCQSSGGHVQLTRPGPGTGLHFDSLP